MDKDDGRTSSDVLVVDLGVVDRDERHDPTTARP
jgi:hypothetical protein